MRSLLLTAILALATFHPAHALDKKAILALAEKPHSRANLVPELKIFANVREYEVNLEIWNKENGKAKMGPLTAREHVVDGKYVVTVSSIPDFGKLVIVVEFDKAKEVYRKWVVPPGDSGDPSEMIGVSLPGTRCISWTPTGDAAPVINLLEHHSDEGASWRQVTLVEGKIVATERGTARKTR